MELSADDFQQAKGYEVQEIRSFFLFLWLSEPSCVLLCICTTLKINYLRVYFHALAQLYSNCVGLCCVRTFVSPCVGRARMFTFECNGCCACMIVTNAAGLWLRKSIQLTQSPLSTVSHGAFLRFGDAHEIVPCCQQTLSPPRAGNTWARHQ